MKKYLAICLCLITSLSLTACGNKDYFTPTIAVEQVLDNIAKASGKASVAGAIDIESFNEAGNEVTDANVSEVASSINTDAIVTPQGIKSETTSFSGSQEADEVTFDSTVVVPEEKEASLLSRLISAITKPKDNKNTSTSNKTNTTSKTNTSNKNQVTTTQPTVTPAPSTPSVVDTAPVAEVIKKEVVETPIDKVVAETPVVKEEAKADETPEDKEEAKTDETPSVSEDKLTPDKADEPVKEDAPDVEEAPVETPVETPETIIPITVLIINECGADATVVSVINPKTNEQVNLGTLGIDEMFILKMDWPSKTKNFRIAVYGADGNIVMQKALEFTGITESAAVILSGSGSLEDFAFEVE